MEEIETICESCWKPIPPEHEFELDDLTVCEVCYFYLADEETLGGLEKIE